MKDILNGAMDIFDTKKGSSVKEEKLRYRRIYFILRRIFIKSSYFKKFVYKKSKKVGSTNE